jgi:hypothetical protein
MNKTNSTAINRTTMTTSPTACICIKPISVRSSLP